MQEVIFRDLEKMEYEAAWNYQEALLQENVRIKSERRRLAESLQPVAEDQQIASLVTSSVFPTAATAGEPDTTNHLPFVEHPPVYTLGKSSIRTSMAATTSSTSSSKARGTSSSATNGGQREKAWLPGHRPISVMGW